MIGRRGFLASAAATGLLAGLPKPAQARPKRPNILLIVTDDQPRETEWALPKTMNWLARQGTNFQNGYCTTPQCSPARSSIFSGRFARNHGVQNNVAPGKLDQTTTVQRALQEAGYRTGLIGKYLNQWDINTAPPYFTEWAIMQQAYENTTFNVNGTVQDIEGYTTSIIQQQSMDFLDSKDPAPWFLTVCPYACHEPYTPEDKYADAIVPDWPGRPSVTDDKSDKPPFLTYYNATLAEGQEARAAQLRALMSVDDLVEALRVKLEQTREIRDTLVIFIGDNGYTWADFGWIRKNLPYNPALKVPFYMSWPGRVHKGNDPRIASNVDIAPTLLDAACLPPAAHHDGHSLLDHRFRRDHLFTEWTTLGVIGPAKPLSWTGYTTPTKQYSEWTERYVDGKGDLHDSQAVVFREYYDLVKDPYQLTNLLHGTTPEAEASLGIPALAAALAADREGRS